MDFYEREQTSSGINFFWRERVASPSLINESVALIDFEALKQARICADSMELVPRPTYGVANAKGGIKKVVKIGEGVKDRNVSIYDICRTQVKSMYGSKVKISLMGVQ